MLHSYHVRNFKCLENVTTSLGPFTILIGPNDSGKTSFLDSVRLLGKLMTSDVATAFEEFGPIQNLVWMRETGQEIGWGIQATTSYGEINYDLGLSVQSNLCSWEKLKKDANSVFQYGREDNQNKVIELPGPDNNPMQIHPPRNATVISAFSYQIPYFASLASETVSSIKYSLDPGHLRQEADSKPEPTLSPTGSDLVAVIVAMLTGPDRRMIDAMEATLHKAVPTICGFSVPKKNGRHFLEFVLSRNAKASLTIPAKQASDGAVLLLGFLALAYGDTPEILLIEEPENGLHFSNLKLVVETLRKISTGEIGNRPRQVLVTTHSPILLNFVEPKEVRVFRRTENGGTAVTSMAEAPNIDDMMKEFGTGELWYLLGEEALLKEAKV